MDHTISMTETFDVTIEDMAFKGEAIARIDGQVMFVPGAIPGEKVRLSVKKLKKGYGIAQVEEILEASPHRVEPPCRYFGLCSGCTWQHIAYPEQLRLKQRVVAEQLRRIGKLEGVEVLPTIGMEKPWEYRNHARFTVNPEGRLGFVQRGTKRFVQIDECMLMAPKINEVLAHFQQRGVPATAFNVRCGRNTDDLLIQPRVDDDRYETGQKQYREIMSGEEFEIASPSFFQVNTEQAEILVGLVSDGLLLDGSEILADVYAGVGTFSAILSPKVRGVYYIEESGPAGKNAQHNLDGLINVMMISGRAEEVFPELPDPPDVVIVDPPRAGLHKRLIDAILDVRPAQIAYISCDPATLARDLAIFSEAGFEIGPVQPVDMFPQTYHIETVTILRALDGAPSAARTNESATSQA